jgi:RNA 3'-terminal phosphate cyclase
MEDDDDDLCRAIRIRRIRENDDNPGLNEHEASVIRLFDKLTNGSKVEVSETGTTLYYQPGSDRRRAPALPRLV